MSGVRDALARTALRGRTDQVLAIRCATPAGHPTRFAMVRVRPLLVRFGFGRTTRSPLGALLVFYLLGVVGSYALGCGMSVLYTGAAQARMGSGVPERIDGVAQPSMSIRPQGERLALNWRSTWCLDNISVERLPEADWREYGESAYPWPGAVEARIQDLRTKHLSGNPSARKPDLLEWTDSGAEMRDDLPYWAAVPAPGSDEAIVHSMGFGWPFRATLCMQVLCRDATTGLIEDPPIWETRSEEVLTSLAWRPIVAGLLADGVVFGGAAWLVWMTLLMATSPRPSSRGSPPRS